MIASKQTLVRHETTGPVRPTPGAPPSRRHDPGSLRQSRRVAEFLALAYLLFLSQAKGSPVSKSRRRASVRSPGDTAFVDVPYSYRGATVRYRIPKDSRSSEIRSPLQKVCSQAVVRMAVSTEPTVEADNQPSRLVRGTASSTSVTYLSRLPWASPSSVGTRVERV